MPNVIKQLLVAGAVVAIIMVFVIQFRPGTNVEVSGGPTCALEISGSCIAHADFVASYRLCAPNIDAEALKQMRLRKVIVDGLIERWLLNEDAKRLGVAVSDQELTDELGKGLARFSLPAAQEDSYLYMLARYMPGQVVPSPEGPARRMLVNDPKTGKFDYERYKRWVGRMSSKTLSDFREFQRVEAVAARMRALVRTRVRVSDREAYAKFARENERLVVDYVKLERSFYKDHVIDRSGGSLDAWAKANEAEVKEAWDERKDAFLPECRLARHIFVRFDETVVDEAERKKKAREVMDGAKKRVDDGDAFADVAREVSQDPRTAKDGGKLGCFAAGKLALPNTTKAVDDTVFALDAVGKISDIVETDVGLYLVKLDKIAKGEDAEKLGRREVILDLYLKQEAERLAAEGSKQILEAVRGGKSLGQALDAHVDAVLSEEAKKAFGEGGNEGEKPRVRTSDPFDQGSPPFSQVQNPPEAASVLFELDKSGAVPSDVIKLYDGYAVAQLKERQPVDEKTWNEKRAEFMASMRAEKQRDALTAYVQRLREQLGKEISYKIKLDEGGEPEALPEE